MALTLNQVREQYPELSGTSDEVLANFLHKNYYSDIPLEDFSKAVGLTSGDEAGDFRSYVELPFLKGTAAIGGAVGYGLEASGIAPETGRSLQESHQRAEEALTARQSQQAREDASKRLIDDEGNYGGYNAGTFAQQVFESAPGMLAMGMPGGLLARGATAGAKAVGVGSKAANTIGSALGFGASEGIFSGASNAEQIQQEIRNASFDKLVDHPAFIEAYHTETDPDAPQERRLEQARDILARKAGDDVFADTAVKTGGISALTGGGIFGMLREGRAGGLLANAGKGMLKEGILQEAPQSALEQRTSNQARLDYLDPNQDLNEGVLTAGIEGGLVGAAMGVAGGAGVRDIGKAETVDDAIAAAGEALKWQPPAAQIRPDAEAIIRNRSKPGLDLQTYLDQRTQDTGYTPELEAVPWETPSATVKPDADAFVANRTVPGKSLQSFLDAQTEGAGYVPGEASQVWETPNTESANAQAEKNRALYEAGAPATNTQLRDQLQGLLARGRSNERTGSDAERNPATPDTSPTPTGTIESAQTAIESTAPGKQTPYTHEDPNTGEKYRFLGDDRYQDAEGATWSFSEGELEPLTTQDTTNAAQDIQPATQPQRIDDRIADTGAVGGVSGNDRNLPEQQQEPVQPAASGDDTGSGSLDSILTTKKQAWINARLKEQQIKPKSPGYGAKFKEAGEAYEQELNKALAKAPFDVFANHPVNSGVPKGDMLKQAHEALRDEFGVADEVPKSTETIKQRSSNTGAWTVEQRKQNAANSFKESVIEQFGLSDDEAQKAFDYYLRNKLIKLNSGTGQFNLSDGRLWDASALKKAAKDQQKPDKQAKNKTAINDGDDILTAIAKLGGLNAAEAKAQGIDPASFGLRGHGIKRVFNHGKNSKSYDSMAEALREQGFDVPMANDLVELVSGAVNQGRKIYTAKGAELQAEIMAQEHVSEQEAQHVLRIESLYEAAKQHDADFGTNYLEIILKLDDLSTDNLSEWEQYLEADRKARQQKTDSDSQTPVSGEAELESYTEQEIADREREQDRLAKQEKIAEINAKQKEKADKEIDTLADEMLGNLDSGDVFSVNTAPNASGKDTEQTENKADLKQEDDIKFSKPKPESVSDFADKIKNDLGLKDFYLAETSKGDIELSSLIVHKDEQKSGKGTQAMERLIAYADSNNKRLVLTPGLPNDNHGTTSRARLVKFYKKFGFVESKGRNLDYEIGAGKMYRYPKSDTLKSTDTGDAFAQQILNKLAEEDEFFRFPISKSKDIAKLFKEIMPNARYVSYQENKGKNKDMPRHFFAIKGGGHFYVYETPDALWLDVSQMKTGMGGSAVYFAAGNYAHNTGKVFTGDPDGLTEDAVIRRTANMLSLALRFGKTDFMDAAKEQREGIPDKGIVPLEWKGSNKDKISALIRTFLSNFQTQFPGIKNARYDFKTGQFLDGRAKPIQREVFDNIREGVDSEGARAARAGAATTRQGILIQSLVSSESSERPGILEHVLHRSRALVNEGDLDRVFSSKNPPKGTSVDELRSWLPKRVNKLVEANKLHIVQSAREIPDNAQAFEAAGAEAFYKISTDELFMIADNITKENFKSVLNHELFHRLEFTDKRLREEIAFFDNALEKRFNLAAKGGGSKIEKAAYRRVMDANVQESDYLIEFKAYLVSEYSRDPDTFFGTIKKIIQDFIAAIRAAMIRVGVPVQMLTPADLTALAKYGARVKDDGVSSGSQSTLRSAQAQGYEGTNTGEAEEWLRARAKGLDMSKEARMQRAKDMGFDVDTTYYHSSHADISIFDKDISDGFWFTDTNDISGDEVGASGTNAVYPVFLRYENPLINGPNYDIFELAEEGYDAVENIYEYGRDVAVMEPNQIRSIHAAFDPDYADSGNLLASRNDDVRYSRTAQDSATVAAAKRKAGLGPKRTLAQAIQDIISLGWSANAQALKERWQALKPQLEQGVFDKFLGIKLAEQEILGEVAHSQSGYIGARLSTGSSSTMQGLLLFGSPEWRDGIIQKKAESKGFAEILQPVKDDIENFTAWMVGRRADRLYREGKENNFTRAEIDALLALKQDSYQGVADDIAAMNKAVLDLAQESGLVDAQSRRLFEHSDYIPFFRLVEGVQKGPRNKQGLSHQTSGIKALKGGENPLSDPLGNMMQNWAHLIDASMKNDALNKTLTNLEGSRFVEPIPRVEFKQAMIPKEQIRKLMQEAGLPDEIIDAMPGSLTSGIAKLWAMQAPTDPDVVRVMRDGKSEYFRVHDGMLLTSLTAVNQSQLGGIFKSMRYMKHLLTAAITADPTFMARNFIRDSMHSWTIAEEKGFKLGLDSFHGAIKSMKEEGGYVDMMFAGASFQGGYGNYNNPDSARESMDAALRRRGIRDIQGFHDSILDTPKKYWEMYRSVGDAIENANREAILENAKRSGAEKAQYLFEAKDIMDFSMQGSFTLIRAMSDMLPFFNARLVGLYRLAKAGKTEQARRLIIAKGLSISFMTLALLALNSDNEDYEALEDFDKDQYWHFFIGDQHYRIPKPFELGLIFGTVPERAARAMIGKDTLKDFGKRMAHGAGDTLAFNPVPQLFKPFVELYSNKNMFTGRPIEGMADEGKLPSARYNEHTSETMRVLSSVLPESLGASPKRLEHLMSGYLGAMGMYALGVSDMMVRSMADMPELPEQRIDRLPVIKGFYQEQPALHTKYGTQLYEMLSEVNQIHRTINAYKKEGNIEKARELLQENASKLRSRKALDKSSRSLSDIRKRIDAIYRSDLGAEEKRRRIDALMMQANKGVQRVVRATSPYFN